MTGGVMELLGRAPLADRKDDLYETPECATRALLSVEKLPHAIWEPACGPGAIARVLREAGFVVHATDLVDYGFGSSGVDFLMERQCWNGAIVTNPPFKLANEFAQHALTLCSRVYLLLRLNFLESEIRRPILDSGQLKRVYVFRNRLPMMHRDGWKGRKANSGMAFAWFVWDRDNRGPTHLHRISWQEKA